MSDEELLALAEREADFLREASDPCPAAIMRALIDRFLAVQNLLNDHIKSIGGES